MYRVVIIGGVAFYVVALGRIVNAVFELNKIRQSM